MKRALIIILGLALAGGGSAQAGPGPGLGSGQGCKAQCIKSALVWSKGTSAKIRVRTDTAAFIKIRVSDKAPWPATPAPHFYTVDASSFSGALKTDWTTTLTGLDAGTVYHIVVEAQDANGRTAFRQGTFTTLKRNVLITFTHIKIVSDAEKGANRGEIEFLFRANQVWHPELHQGIRKLQSGDVLKLPGRGLQLLLPDAPRWLELRVQGVEHDWTTSYCSDGVPPFQSLGFDGDCNQHATALEMFDLDNLPDQGDSLPSLHDAEFFLETDDHRLKFRAYGTIDVSFG